MAYQDVSNFSNGDDLLAATLNQILDNIRFLHEKPSCRVFNSANITISTASATALTFNSERHDNASLHSTASNTSRITFTTAGFYRVGANVVFDTNTTNWRELTFRVNGTTKIGQVTQKADGYVGLSYEVPWPMAAGDYVECVVYQNSGGDLDVIYDPAFSPEFWAEWVAG